MQQNKTIHKLKEARARYISLKEQHCPKGILKFWGDECIRLRKKLKSSSSEIPNNSSVKESLTNQKLKSTNRSKK